MLDPRIIDPKWSARASSAVSIGEVQTCTHISTESEDHFESSSREFSNPNKCHAIAFYFYRIIKMQTIKYTIDSIQRRVIDQIDNTKVTNNPFISSGQVSVIPNGLMATDKERLEVEERGRAAASAGRQDIGSVGNIKSSSVGLTPFMMQISSPQALPLERKQ